MDRLALLKESYLRTKTIQKKIKRSDAVSKFRSSHKENGLCRSCSKELVNITYTFEGRVLYEKKSKFCPDHWESPVVKALLMKGRHDSPVSASIQSPPLPSHDC